jgi:hypothetical protein
MNVLCTSETFLSTPLLISPHLQDGLSLYFWDIHINTTTDLTWSTIRTVFVLLRHFYQHRYWSHLIYKMNCLSTSETLLSTPLLISPDLQNELTLNFWDIAINTTTDLTWSTRWTVFLLLRHSYQHHYWSHLIYKMNCVCSSETFLSTPLLISPDLDGRSVFFWNIPINTTTDFTWSTRWTVFVLLRHIESNTGGVQDREILPKGVGDFPILYFFRCLILFLTKHLIVLFTFHGAFSLNFFSIAKVNIRFIHMHPCLGSILNVFHNKIQCI